MSSLKHFLRQQINQVPVTSLENSQQPHACVSVILKGSSVDNLSIGFIERALHPEDRWSGHIAFPGGRREDSDPSHLAGAIRETKEEINLLLSEEDLIGPLSDIQARRREEVLNFYIRPYVFWINRDHSFSQANEEVADFFWIQLSQLLDTNFQTSYAHLEQGHLLSFPAINVGKKLPLWGLSYLMTQELIKKIERL